MVKVTSVFHCQCAAVILWMVASPVLTQTCVLPNASWYPARDRCYWRLGKYTTAVGETLCQQHGGHLSTVYDQATTDWLHANVLDGNCGSVWTGANDIAKERTWVLWDDSPVQWTNWASGQPAGWTTINCVMLDGQCKWRDRQCIYTYKVLCEGPAIYETTSTDDATDPTTGAATTEQATTTELLHTQSTMCSALTSTEREIKFQPITEECTNHVTLTSYSNLSRLTCARNCQKFDECVGFAYKGKACKLLQSNAQSNCFTGWRIFVITSC